MIGRFLRLSSFLRYADARYFTSETVVAGMNPMERYREIIPEFDRFLASIELPLPVTAWVNTLKTTVSDVTARLDDAGVAHRPMGWNHQGLRLDVQRPGRLIEHHIGHIHLQEEISMVPALVLEPKSGEHILDLCASPGGKTAQISARMGNSGMVVANDSSGPRIVALRSNLERLGVLNAAVTMYDGRRFPEFLFDRALVDAPCSSEGTCRRNPAVLMRSGMKRSLDLQRLQVSLLRRALSLTRSGGTVVYSTCTFAPEENEAVVSQVMDIASLKDAKVPGLISSPGLVRWGDRNFCDEMIRCTRYYPHQNDTGGFFVALLVKH